MYDVNRAPPPTPEMFHKMDLTYQEELGIPHLSGEGVTIYPRKWIAAHGHDIQDIVIRRSDCGEARITTGDHYIHVKILHTDSGSAGDGSVASSEMREREIELQADSMKEFECANCGDLHDTGDCPYVDAAEE